MKPSAGRGFMAQKVKLRNWKGLVNLFRGYFRVHYRRFTPGIVDLQHPDASNRRLQPEQFHPGALDRAKRYNHKQWRAGGSAQSQDLEGCLELDQIILIHRLFHCHFWGHPGICNRQRARHRLSKIVEQLAFIPYVIPGIAFGAVYISMFTKPFGPIPALYGTFALAGGGISRQTYSLLIKKRCFCHAAGGQRIGRSSSHSGSKSLASV